MVYKNAVKIGMMHIYLQAGKLLQAVLHLLLSWFSVTPK